MHVWSHLPTIINRRFALLIAGLLTLFVALTTTLLFADVSLAAPGINQKMSFQGRLLTSTGGLVADGRYNMQFKIYQDGTGAVANNPDGSLAWTESYVNNNANQGVIVKNGYFSVDLGSNTPLSGVDWNNDTLWLSINIAGSAADCSTFGTAPCADDGEMLPMKRLTSTPYAMNAGKLGGKQASEFLFNTTSPQTASFNITGTGTASSLLSSNFDTATSTGLSLGGTNATQIALQQNTTVGPGKTFAANGSGFDGSGNLGIGTLTPARPLDITTNSNSTSSLSMQIKQTGTGDAGIEIATSTSSTYSVGVDESAGSFKISSSRASGSGGTSFGVTTPGALHENDSANFRECSPYNSGAGGELTSLSAHALEVPAASNYKTIGAIYTDYLNDPYNLVAATQEATIVNGWNTVTISATLTANTTYWICFNTNTTAGGWSYDTSAGAMRFYSAAYSTTWPSTLTSSNSADRQMSFYGTYAGSESANLLDNGLFELSDIGEATFTTTENSETAFKIQGSDGNQQLNINSTQNRIKIGDNTGEATLLTLDQSASAPTNAMLGGMYYDSTLGEVQCYEASGWGSCGASPDTFITLSPEYSNAVMNGADIGTITSDLCSDQLNVNDGSSSQPTICGTNETYNFYKWTSAENSAQTRSIYVTYQLPANFKEFVADSTSLMGRTDDTNASVSYQIYRDGSTGLVSCSSEISVSTGAQTNWQQALAETTNDPASCNFEAGDSILFRINLTAHGNANAYVSNLNFTYSNN